MKDVVSNLKFSSLISSFLTVPFIILELVNGPTFPEQSEAYRNASSKRPISFSLSSCYASDKYSLRFSGPPLDDKLKHVGHSLDAFL